MRLVDKRYKRLAVGVGTSIILGRIHAYEVKINGVSITCTFDILQNNDVEFLLGLDTLRRHQCCIDLRKNALIFPNQGMEAQFLAENKIQKKAVSKEHEERIKKALEAAGLGRGVPSDDQMKKALEESRL